MLFKAELDLWDSTEWSWVTGGNYDASPGPSPDSWFPITPINFKIQQRILLIGLENQNAKPTWYSAAWFNAFASIAPGATSKFSNGAMFYEQLLPVNQMRLIILPDLGEISTFLRGVLKVRKWYNTMWVEVWQYNGPLSTEVEEKLTQMQAKINSL